MRLNVFEGATAGNFAQQVNRPQSGDQGEVQSFPYRFVAPAERQSWGCAAQIRFEGCECEDDPGYVSRCATIDNVEIIGQTRRTVADGCSAADDDELDAALRQGADQASKISFHDRIVL